MPELALVNEDAFRSRDETIVGLDLIARTMLECVYEGCHTGGTLPGGLNVTRRAEGISRQLIGEA
ncbi:L-serine ammonia-lyase, partial [Acinetobacter baumannii]